MYLRLIFKFLILLLLSAASIQAATVTHEVITADTGGTPNTSGAFTPAVGDLLVVFVAASVTVQATATLTDSAGITFTQVGRVPWGTNVNSLYLFVSNSLAPSATSQTVTFDTASDPATGTVIAVASITGVTRTGLTAILQSTGQANQAAGTPAPVFGAGVDTNNPTLGAVANNTSPAGLTPPTSWTENGDTGYSTPTTGMEYVSRDSGFTGTTITWGSASASVFASGIIEIDTSVVASAPSNLLLVGIGK